MVQANRYLMIKGNILVPRGSWEYWLHSGPWLYFGTWISRVIFEHILAIRYCFGPVGSRVMDTYLLVQYFGT